MSPNSKGLPRARLYPALPAAPNRARARRCLSRASPSEPRAPHSACETHRRCAQRARYRAGQSRSARRRMPCERSLRPKARRAQPISIYDQRLSWLDLSKILGSYQYQTLLSPKRCRCHAPSLQAPADGTQRDPAPQSASPRQSSPPSTPLIPSQRARGTSLGESSARAQIEME
jgi:hypothetical protein